MALTLDPVLAAAQDAQSRRPLCEILSKRRIDDIPFDGSLLTAETFSEFGPNVIPHSTGCLCLAYCYGPDGDGDSGIKYVCTDPQRQEFATTTIELFTSTAYVMKGVSLCELTDGNIGLVYLYTYNNAYYLACRIVTIEGVAVDGSVKAIANWATTAYGSDPWVQTIGENAYLLVYGKQSGANYYIYKRTSADFLTWSAESALSISGLTSTWKLANPSLLKISTGDLCLFFDALEASSPSGDPLTNIYYSVSSDAGATWSAAVKVTNYTQYGEIGAHPVAAQKTANQMNLLWTQINGALHMTDAAPNWPTGDWSAELSFDAVNRKLYVVNTYTAFDGYNNDYGIQCIVKIDLDTWSVEQYWDATTTPAIPAKYFITGSDNLGSGHIMGTAVNDGPHIVYAYGDNGYYGTNNLFLFYLDCEGGVLRDYEFKTAAYPNRNVKGFTAAARARIICTFVDASDDKIWIAIQENSDSANIRIGYLTISDAGTVNPATGVTEYTFTTVITHTFPIGYYATQLRGGGWDVGNDIGHCVGGMYVDLNTNQIVISGGVMGNYASGTYGSCTVFDIESAAVVKQWLFNAGSPEWLVVHRATIVDGKVYAPVQRGGDGLAYRETHLGIFDPATGEYEVVTPSYIDGSYYLSSGATKLTGMSAPKHLGDNILAVIHRPYGVALYDIATREWSRFGNDNIPGFASDGDMPSQFSQIVYDAENNMIMLGDLKDKGVIAFNAGGYIRRTHHSIGTYSGGLWSFAAAAAMMEGFFDYDAACAVEPGSTTAMFVFWSRWSPLVFDTSIAWDKDGSTMDLSPYIAGEVATEAGIDGNPAALNFQVSHGHLFDQWNLASALKSALKKGNELKLRWGENVSGTEYFHNAGTFIVVETSLSFMRGNYPVMTVRAEDPRAFWQHSHVYATAIFNNLPGKILESVLTTHAGLAVADLNIPVFAGGSLLDHQWIESGIIDIIQQVCDRFCYYFRFDVDGKASARPITNAAAVDHAYADNTRLISYTPDDRYSDFTNRVTVRGQSKEFITVTYAEERMGGISGTLGWWGCRADHRIWFSQDMSRRCIEPRMVVLESACGIAMALAGGIDETLEVGPTTGKYANKFCTIRVGAPNLVPNLIASMAGYLAACMIPDPVWAAGFVANAGSTIPVGSLIQGIAMITIVTIIGSVANYSYDVYAKPLGEIRQSCQGQWNDTTHQAEISAIVEQTIDDPLCYSQEDCESVAGYEGMVAQMQRRRIRIEKIAHLQDEDGDTITIPHPYSGQAVKLFVARLSRKYKKSDPERKDGYFTDEIEGWVCE